MPRKRDETTFFRYVRTLDGGLTPVELARRNGRLVPRFPKEAIEPELPDCRKSEFGELLREVMYGLRPRERRTWLLLLFGHSVSDIAAREHVSRAAIYERIRGSSRGHGGMIRKNDYVAIWWRNQLKTKKHE